MDELRSSYIPLDAAAAFSEHGEYVQSGESCRVDALKDHFAWMRGFVNAWYGWANDGKGQFTDYMMLLKSIRDGWKWCVYKQEDMDTVVVDGKVQIKANRIYKNLAWIYSGKTWNRGFSEKYRTPAMTMDEEREALDFVTEHFFVIYPSDRKYQNILDDFRFMYDKKGIDGFMLDPWNTVKLDESKRGDHMLVDAFIDIKEFAMLTNSVFNIVSHPRTLHDVKQGKEKNSPYKVVNQFMQLGGAAWDIKMDGQYSVYRPQRHLDVRNPTVEFHNLKQRQHEIVGVNKGCVESIEFDFIKKQYTFSGINPLDGSMKELKKEKTELFADELPF